MSNNTKEFLIIEAGKSERHYFADLWRYRELFYFFSWRDILVRYKQTVIGIAWAVLKPLLTMIAFTLIFGRLAKLPSTDAPYPVLVFVALLPWQFFTTALGEASNSLISNSTMISKIYFPRMIMPISTVIVALIDFVISIVLLGIVMGFYRFVPSWKIVFMPLFLILSIIFTLGIGLLFSALNVKYRDFRYIVPFIVTFGTYISPVGFSSDIVPERFRMIYSINPMVGVIDGFRWSIIGKGVSLYMPGFIISIVLTIAIFFVGILYFRKTERTFADRI
jgi:lipopolysaccharide transport system permease protein